MTFGKRHHCLPLRHDDSTDDDTENKQIVIHPMYCMDIMVDDVNQHTLGQHKRVTVHLVGAVLQKKTVLFMDRVHVDGASHCTL